MRLFINSATMAAVVLLFVAPAWADDPGKSLDEQLQENLGADLLDGLDDLPLGDLKPQPKEPSDSDSPDAGAAEKDDVPPDTVGEDIGEVSEDNPFLKIGGRMRNVEARIARHDPSEPTQQLQDQIVKDLEELIEEIKRRKKSPSSSQSKSPPGSRRSKIKQSGQQPSEGDGQTAKRPAQDSSERLGREAAKEIDLAEMNALIKDIWGTLPDRERERMNQAAFEEFLPKYKLMIEKYFRRLAEKSAE